MRNVRLKHSEEGHPIQVDGPVTLGRSDQCDVVVSDKQASAVHAKLEWLNGRWHARDLGSKNGTFVNDRRVLPGEPHPLRVNDRLSLGPSSPGWRVEDDGPPNASLEATPALPEVIRLERATLILDFPANEEQILATVRTDQGQTERWPAREHHYLLLTLARAKLEDAEASSQARGWRNVAELCRMMRVQENYLHLMVHRARRSFEELGFVDAAGIVEVRRGRRRLGPIRCELRRSAP